MNARDLVYQGTWYFHHVTRATHLRARELFRQACELDPELPEAKLWLARVNAGLVAYAWSDDEDYDLREGIDAAIGSVQIDEKSPYAHYSLAIISVYAGALHQAILAAEKALELSPSFALGHLVLGMAHLFSGAAAEAIKPLEHGLRLNPQSVRPAELRLVQRPRVSPSVCGRCPQRASECAQGCQSPTDLAAHA